MILHFDNNNNNNKATAYNSFVMNQIIILLHLMALKMILIQIATMSKMIFAFLIIMIQILVIQISKNCSTVYLME